MGFLAKILSSRASRASIFVASVALSTPAAEAAFLTPANWVRETAFTSRHEWNVFTSTTGTPTPNAPDVAQFPSTWSSPATGATVPNVADSSGASFVTSGGNIYSPTAPTFIDVDLPHYNAGDNYFTTLLLQVRTQGTEPIHDGATGVRLTYGGTTITSFEHAELSRVALGGFGGFLVDHAYVFHVPTSPDSLKIEIDAAGSSMSLDSIAVDAVVTRATAGSSLLGGMNTTIGYVPQPLPQPIPEPTAAAAMGIAAVGMLARRRRRSVGGKEA